MVSDETIERLEAEAKIHEADPEELSVYPESTVEGLEEEVEELSDELSEAEDEVESAGEELAEKEAEIESMEEEIEAVAEVYAEKLEEATGLDSGKWMDRFDVSELREEYEERVEGGEVEELAEEPDPQSGNEVEEELDEDGPDLTPDEEEQVEALESQIANYEGRGGAWASHAEKLREEKEEILAE